MARRTALRVLTMVRGVLAHKAASRAGASTVASSCVFPIARPARGRATGGRMWLSGVLPATARDEPGGAGRTVPVVRVPGVRSARRGPRGDPGGRLASALGVGGAARAQGRAGAPGGPYGHRTGTPLERGHLSRMGITVCNVPAAPQASPFTAVMTLITYCA